MATKLDKVNDNDFREIVKESKSYTDMLDKIGYKRYQSYLVKRIKERIKNNGIDSSHIDELKTKVYSVSDEQFEKFILESKSYNEVIKKLGYTNGGGGTTSKSIKERVEDLGIECEHFEIIKKGKIKSVIDEEFIKIVQESETYIEMLRKCGCNTYGGNVRALKERINEMSIDMINFKGQSHSKDKKIPENARPKYTLDELLVKGSYIRSNDLKKKLFNANMLENRCQICELGPEWNNKKLVLQLDHINGDSTDNRIENLRILCPNCHSQTDTFCSKNKTSTRYDI